MLENTEKTLKKMIEFADETWNPVRGCLNNCPYCFARKNNKRFPYLIGMKEDAFRSEMEMKAGIKEGYRDPQIFSDIEDFKPVLMYSQLGKKFKKDTTHVFVNSMSDIMFWNPTWWQLVLSQVKKYPEKKFIFFTKDIKTEKRHDYAELLRHQENAVLIYTINTQKDYEDLAHIWRGHVSKVGICIEPMQDKIKNEITLYMFDWVIIGAETGNRKGKIEVKPEWIEPFYDLKMPVFMKESIRSLVPPGKFRQERI